LPLIFSVNLGKWVMRYLFARLIDEEIERDSQHRKDLEEGRDQQTRLQRNAPPSIQMPSVTPGWEEGAPSNGSNTALRPGNSVNVPLYTPGLSIGVATPRIQPHGTQVDGQLPTMVEEGPENSNRVSQSSQPRSSSERSGDYFGLPMGNQPVAESETKSQGTANETAESQPLRTPGENDKDAQPKETSLFGKKFRIPFGGKKIGRSSSVSEKAVAESEKVNDSDTASRSSDAKTNVIEDNFLGIIQTIRLGYSNSTNDPNTLATTSGITPSPPNETPVLKPPLETVIIIQEDRPESGGIADLYRGTVGTVGEDADLIEKVAPMWLGDLLLKVSLLDLCHSRSDS
jgi:WD repeat-containing protein 48